MKKSKEDFPLSKCPSCGNTFLDKNLEREFKKIRKSLPSFLFAYLLSRVRKYNDKDAILALSHVKAWEEGKNIK